MAWLMRHAMAPYERRVAQRKRALFTGLAEMAGGSPRDLVLEIGCGTRANSAYLPPNARWIGADRNPRMRPPLCAAAERLPFACASVDVVISTLVLCSVADPAVVLAEVRRVLRPGGRFLFLEHVAAPPGTRWRRWQQRLRPFCHACAGGCDPLRNTGATIVAAGFAEVALEEFALGFPHIVGQATR